MNNYSFRGAINNLSKTVFNRTSSTKAVSSYLRHHQRRRTKLQSMVKDIDRLSHLGKLKGSAIVITINQSFRQSNYDETFSFNADETFNNQAQNDILIEEYYSWKIDDFDDNIYYYTIYSKFSG